MKRKIKLIKCLKFFIVIIAVIFCIDILKNSFLSDVAVDGIEVACRSEDKILAIGAECRSRRVIPVFGDGSLVA